MSKSRARFLAEVLGTTGLVKKSKSALAGADEVIDLTSLPSIPNSKLTNSSISIAGHSTALGGSVTLDTADIGEDTNLYFTNARARGAISVSGNAISYNSSTGVLTANFEEGPVFTGSVTAAGLTSSAATNINAAFTVKNNYNETKFVRNADVSSVGAAGYYLSIGALNGSSVVTPNVINAVTDTDGTSSSFAIMQDGANSLSFNSSKNATFAGHVTISGTNNVYVGDNGKFIAGASDDLQIYHNVNDSIIRDAGTGRLILGSSEFLVTNAALSETQIKSIEDGAVSLYHNGNEKLETTSTGIDVTGVAVVDGLTSSGAVTSTSGSNSFGATTFTSGITIAGLTSSAAVTSTTSNSNAFGGTNFTGTISVSGNTLSDTSRNVYTNNISAAGNITVTGNLTVNGTTTTINAATLDVEDKNITLNYGTGDTSSSANGAGITIQDAEDSSTDATITWSTAGNNFNVSHSWNTLGYLQHSGVLYSRNNLTVLNSAGNGWNTWAERINGNFNLNVGSIQTAGTILANNVGSDKKFRWLRTGGNAFSLEHDASGYYFWNETTSDMLMRFTNAGNVGIGVNAPDQALMVKGTIETQATNSANGWQLYTHTDDTFRINYNGAGSDEVFINPDGRVGINTTSPVSGHKLTVNGKIGGPTYVDSYVHFDQSTGNTILKANDDLILGYAGTTYVKQNGALLVGSSTTQASSSEKFLVYSTGNQHSRFMNSSDTYTTVYIKNSSTTANTNQPFLTFQDTGGNRGNFGLRYSTAQLVIQGHGGVGIAGGSGGISSDPDLFVNTSGRVGVGTTTIDAGTVLDVEGNMVVNTASSTGFGEGGIFFRRNYTTAYPYNVSILTYAHDGSGGFSDGLSINGYDGVSFCTGSNTRQERMRIVGGTGSTSGFVGIGTIHPDARLEVEMPGNDVSTDPKLRVTAQTYPNIEFYSRDANAANRNWKISSVYNHYGTLEFLRSSAANGVPNISTLVMKNDGNIGIGTTNPGSKLVIHEDDSSFANTELHIHNNKSDDAAVLRLEGKRTSSNDTGQIIFANSGNIGASIRSYSGGDEGSLRFYTSIAGTGDSVTERMRIDADGDVIINNNLKVSGTKTYSAANLAESNSANMALQISPMRSGTNSGISIGDFGSSRSGIQAYNNSTNAALTFLLNPFGGNVAVGTTSADQTLTVKGANSRVSAQSTADGQTIGFEARYLNHGSLYGSFLYTTGDAQLYIDNHFQGNNGVYSDINFRNQPNGGGGLINRLKIKGSTGHVGIGVETPAHQLTVQHDSDPSIYIVGNGYNDTVRIGFGGGDVTNAMGSGNTGAIISSAQTTSGGAALGDLRFQINKGDNLQTALHISNQGFSTFDHQGNDYGVSIKSSGSSRSGLVILTPGTTTITGSLLVLSDASYRLGTASHYHFRANQDGKTQVGFDQPVSVGDHFGNSYPAARFNVNNGTGTSDGATGKTVWYGPKGRGHKSFAGQDAFNIWDLQREWTGKHVDNGGNTVNQTSSQNYTNDHGITVNYPSNVTSQQLIYSETPKGGAGTILRAQADNYSGWNGGFQSGGFPCSTHVGLQYSMYIRRSSSNSAGTFYMGCFNAYPGGTSTTVNTNPYFIVTSMASLPQDVWCLVVAYLAPINYNSTLPGTFPGIYRLDTGDRITGQTNYRHYSTTQNIRTYMYYAGDSSTKCDWYAPRVHLVDGTEPTITQLMGLGRVYGSSTDL